ncbi:MAG: diacylglycerol kinase family lipid kinase [Dehalococcoidia bacterium]|nr:diacylglycerol kinase family lipid kinase [Dehalococcoidia bacterium]MCL4231318.1 diacylglycerol kinase family lipid kinase [Dehalococcoidia bacterium]NUQ56291.1 diacylglycerol kinase family lipid kinase [Dehalococcoidia bacterium]
MSPQIPSPARAATVLVNMAARGVAGKVDPGRFSAYLAERAVEARVIAPPSPADSTREAYQAARRGEDFLFVVGGDGTVRVCAEGLAGSNTALAPIRGGTANVLAHETGIPRGFFKAIDAHLAGQRVRMDLGRARDLPFLLMAGVGWDADVARSVPARLKRVAGPLAYVAEGAWKLPRLRTHVVRWSCDGETHEEPLAVMVIGNTRLYGSVVHVTPRALADDGLLDVCALAPRRPLDGTRISARLLLRRHEGDPRAFVARAREIGVQTPGLPVQLDGDYVAETPLRFTVDHGALLLSVPAGKLPPIFGG